MVILVDISHMLKAKHQSGLVRVTQRLMDALTECDGIEVIPVQWHARKACLLDERGKTVAVEAGMNYLLVPPVSPDERPGLSFFLAESGVKHLAVFHDAIPLKHPEITWPKSVARHPSYMKSLAEYDQVLAVSDASMKELREYWRESSISPRASLSRIQLGADFCEESHPVDACKSVEDVLMVGILEPRKNQELMLDVWEQLGQYCECPVLHLVGRVNPHFGKAIRKRARKMQKKQGKVVYHEGISDEAMRALYDRCSLAVFPSVAEGCGLPVLEALWMGLPVLCSPLPSHRESAVFGGVQVVDDWSVDSWIGAISSFVRDQETRKQLCAEINQGALPLWSDSAAQISKVIMEE